MQDLSRRFPQTGKEEGPELEQGSSQGLKSVAPENIVVVVPVTWLGVMVRPRSYTFRIESLLAATPAAVWARITTMSGVNAELLPLARMTYPPEAERIDVATVPLRQRLFRSWILLFGFLPVEYDDLSFEAIDPGRSFREVSTLLSQRRWVHERSLEAVGTGCRLTDQLELEPRVLLLGPLYVPVFRWFFAHRHRRLRRHFGTLQGN